MPDSPVLVGSVPPPYDTFWRHIERKRYNITLFERNINNPEKEVDTTIASRIVQTIYKRGHPAIIALVAGDLDFRPPINIALDKGWKVELWHWDAGIKRL